MGFRLGDIHPWNDFCTIIPFLRFVYRTQAGHSGDMLKSTTRSAVDDTRENWISTSLFI